MQPNITTKNMELLDSTRDYVTDKVGRLNKYFHDNITNNIDVLLKFEETLKSEEQYHCEIIIQVPHSGSIVIDVARKDINSAIDLAVDKCERQCRRVKEKREGSRRKSARLMARTELSDEEAE